MNSGFIHYHRSLADGLKLGTGDRWFVIGVDLILPLIAIEQIEFISSGGTIIPVMTQVHDQTHMGQTTVLKKLSVPLAYPMEWGQLMTFPAASSAEKWPSVTIFTFVYPILPADKASPVLWRSLSLQEMM